MIRKLIYLFFMVALLNGFLYATNSLRVGDPSQGSWTYQGTLEEAVISIKPKGLYMEYGLYLTFSARGTYYTSDNKLEVQFYFELPENAIVYDSWLWMDDTTIVRAKIMDKWTAAEIYEDIVDRRRDPSILFKKSSTQYELRVYPMPGNETRKVKITYLMPANWTAYSIISGLPTKLLRTSRYPLSTFHLLTWLSDMWKNPKIIEFPDINFETFIHPDYGEFIRADVPSEAIYSEINYQVDAPFNNGTFLSRYENGDDKYYQLAILPSKILDISTPRKAAILFDNYVSNTNLSATDILNNVKSALHTGLSPTDSFNLIFSGLNINRINEDWLPADSLTIENIFAGFTENPIANYSNLPSLLANGINFIQTHGNDGSIILISSSDFVGAPEVANQLIDDLFGIMDPALPIHVCDFQNQNYTYYWIGGRYYYGNEYFYMNISRLTRGNYNSLRNGNSFHENLLSIIQSLSGFINSFDLYTSLENGFCYGRFNLSGDNFSTYLNTPILQLGKYLGELPFNIQISGVYNTKIFSYNISLDETETGVCDSLIEEGWHGNYIRMLENQDQTNDIVNAIIDASIYNRVLSKYTAFLCLEPEMGGEVCYDCMDETVLSVQNDTLSGEFYNDSLVTAYPNPFNSQITLNIKLNNNFNGDKYKFEIYNILGQKVKTFYPNPGAGNRIEFHWDGTDEAGESVPSGYYLFRISAGELQKSMKLLLIK